MESCHFWVVSLLSCQVVTFVLTKAVIEECVGIPPSTDDSSDKSRRSLEFLV